MITIAYKTEAGEPNHIALAPAPTEFWLTNDSIGRRPQQIERARRVTYYGTRHSYKIINLIYPSLILLETSCFYLEHLEPKPVEHERRHGQK